MAVQKTFRTVSADTWTPLSDTLTGTNLSSSGTVVTGSGTSFLSEVERGAWLVTDSGTCRQVKFVNSDTELVLFEPFDTDLSAAAVTFIDKNAAKMLYVLITNNAGVDVTVNGETLTDGKAVEWGQPNKGGERNRFVKPIYIETTGNVSISTEWIGNSIGV